MRENTALPRLTPIPTLQEHAQLNTLTGLVNQREQARILISKHIPAAAALHSYFYGGPSLTATLDDIQQWCYTNITTNKTTKLHRSDQPATAPETSIHQGQCVIYTDAAVLPRGGQVAFVSPSHPGIQATWNYKSDTPDFLLLQLQAIHDAIKALISLPDIKEPLLDLPPASLPSHPRSNLTAPKNLLRRDTRALIPSVCLLPSPLWAWAALTPSVTWIRGHTPADPGICTKCPALVSAADAHHLLWLCSGTKTTREKILSEPGLKGHLHDNYTQW
ncbi:hypothetical protein HPB47_020781 [Ixodes persulcatus]|uniref:Uncharacterized protein n=1 Tax=Ixodes persulcatus TaxID=34615 RepID=A0AC60QGU6_IXOPE|nr:hypothetical protein HPB47_020781 [Ixodes persulcatus]